MFKKRDNFLCTYYLELKIFCEINIWIAEPLIAECILWFYNISYVWTEYNNQLLLFNYHHKNIIVYI